MPKTLRLIAGCLIVVALALAVFSQTATQLPELDKNGKPVFPRPSPHISYSPSDLSHGSITLPASAATPNTSIIKTGAATKMTLFVNCTQAVNLSVNVYIADDQSGSSPNWTLYATYPLVTGIAAGAHQVYIATELAPNSTSGTVVTSFRLPQIALSFFETNTTATAGSCTDRVIVGY